MRRRDSIVSQLDWMTIFVYGLLVFSGWLTIHAAIYDPEIDQSLFDLGHNSGKQLLWIGISTVLIFLILLVDYKFFSTFSIPLYVLGIALLLAVLVLGREVSGSKSWFELGGIRIQPAELAKYATALTLAKLMSILQFDIKKPKYFLGVGLVILIPMALIILQGDTGSALVFTSFVLVFFREGLPAIFLILGVSLFILFLGTLLVGKTYMIVGLAVILIIFILFQFRIRSRIILGIAGFLLSIGTVISVDYIFSNILKPHQQNRIKVFLNPNADPTGAGWQVTQSKIAIGSGGFWGKGYLKGTQTKFDFIPDQSTDNIFCTIGEEFGFIGSFALLIAFATLLYRIIRISERQKNRFTRIYGYTVFSIVFFHFAVNIGMTIGLFPVVGIPLPFLSYGGSALIGFTLLLFTLVKLDAHRSQILGRS